MGLAEQPPRPDAGYWGQIVAANRAAAVTRPGAAGIFCASFGWMLSAGQVAPTDQDSATWLLIQIFDL